MTPRALFVAFTVYTREGGLERFNRRVVRALGELAGPAELDVLASWDHEHDRPSAPAGAGFFPAARGRLLTLWLLIRLALARRPALVCYGHVLLWPLAVVTRLLCPRSPHVLFVHGIEGWDRPGALKRFFVARCFDRVASVSRFTAEKMAAGYGLPRERFDVLANAVDVEDASSPAPTEAAVELHGSRRLLTVCRLSATERQKNVDAAVRAMPQILSRFPDTHYYVVGEGELKAELKALAAELGVERNVHFVGSVSDETRDRLYAAADVFVLPSSKEGFGIVFLEAWKYRIPAVCGNRDAAHEVVRHGVDGLCVDPTPQAVAEAVCELLADDGRRRTMGESGRRRLEEHYGHDRFVHALGEIIRRCRRLRSDEGTAAAMTTGIAPSPNPGQS